VAPTPRRTALAESIDRANRSLGGVEAGRRSPRTARCKIALRSRLQTATCPAAASPEAPLQRGVRLARTLLLLRTAADLPRRKGIMKSKLKKLVSIWVCQGCEAANSVNAGLCLHCGRERNHGERLELRH
jgi:ribosomal protein L40E